MVKKLSWLMGALMVLGAASAMAQTVPLVDRAITLPVNTGAVGLDLSLGLDKSAAGKRFAVANEYFGDRYSGLTFAYSIIDHLELGLGLQMGWMDKDKYANDGFHLYGVDVYGKFSFFRLTDVPGGRNILETGVELQINMAGQNISDNRVGVTLGIPIQWHPIPGMLMVHVRPDLVMGFAKKELWGDKMPQIGIVFDGGVTFNATPELFFDVSGGFQKLLSPDMDLVPAMAITAGYTVIPAMDLFMNFTFSNLDPAFGDAIDAKGITLGATYRFP